MDHHAAADTPETFARYREALYNAGSAGYGETDMTQRKAEILLASLIIARSASFLFSKIGLASLGLFNMIALRYLMAFAILGFIFRKKLMHVHAGTVIRSAVLSAVFFAILVAELNGLKRTDASTTAFLENSAVVFVPLFHALVIRKLPKAVTIVSSLIALCGIFCLTMKGGALGIGTGEIFALGAALMYTTYILVSSAFGNGKEIFEMGVLQNGFLGLYGLIASCFFEMPRLPETMTEWGCILGLAVICSAFGLTLQPVAQSHTTPERAGLLCAISPVSASIMSMIFMGERLGVSGLIGAALIMSSIFIPKLETAFKGALHSLRSVHVLPSAARVA